MISFSFLNHFQGVFQAIGLKEFRPYFKWRQQQDERGDDKDPIPLPSDLFSSIGESVVRHTQQYAKAQWRWVTRHLTSRAPDPIYLVDTSFLSGVANPATGPTPDQLDPDGSTIDISSASASETTNNKPLTWEDRVATPACDAVKHFIEGRVDMISDSM